MSRWLFIVVVLLTGCQAKPLPTSLDQQGPYTILVTPAAKEKFAKAVQAAQEIHPHAQLLTLHPESPQVPETRYALLVMLPEEISVEFAWRWLWLSTQVDDDPLVDVRTGYITGATPEDAEALVRRTELALARRTVDNLGPNTQLSADACQSFPGSSFLPVFDPIVTVSHGSAGLSQPELLEGAGFLHLGGHGYPDRIVDGLTSAGVGQLRLSPCVVFNGVCYTGVTSTWFENGMPNRAGTSFGLEMLKQPVVGYLAAVLNDQLKSSFTDTFHSDLSQPFNERVRVRLPLVHRGEITDIEPEGRLVGQAVESDGEKGWTHVQIDYPATGFFQSERRDLGATVRFTLK